MIFINIIYDLYISCFSFSEKLEFYIPNTIFGLFLLIWLLSKDCLFRINLNSSSVLKTFFAQKKN